MNENRNNDCRDFMNDKIVRVEFRSRYSIVLILIVLIPMIFMIYNFIKNPILPIFIIIVIFALIILIVSGVRYIITDNRLIFKTCFIYNGEVSINSIDKVERTYLALSSNAGALKRLGLTLKKGSKYPFLLMSPKNESKFIELIKQINPNIEFKVANKKGFYRFWDWDL